MIEYGADKYYEELNGKKVICVDFDNTICLDEWPYIGPVIEDGIKVLKELIRNGHRLILFTQRESQYPICCKELRKYAIKYGCEEVYGDGRVHGGPKVDILTGPLNICEENGLVFKGINRNPEWETLTNDYSRKVFADYFIDDHSVGMKYNMVTNKFGEQCKVCDWKFIDEWFVNEGLYKEKVL